MRNILQYPVTHTEIIEALERASKRASYNEQGKMVMGSIDPLAINLAIEQLKELWNQNGDKSI